MLALAGDLVPQLGFFPDSPRWSGPGVGLAGTAALLVVAIPLLRRTQVGLVAPWPVMVCVVAVATLLDTTGSALEACDVALAASAPVMVVARESLLLGMPAADRFV
ncbi:MAG: hypothetical protein WKG00_33605, partial [Polyangiaceae bacterium]